MLRVVPEIKTLSLLSTALAFHYFLIIGHSAYIISVVEGIVT
jgi:hypothetical protein